MPKREDRSRKIGRGEDPRRESRRSELRPERLRELVDRARRGDREAFAELVECHRGIAAAKAFGTLGDVHLTADALQEAFLKAWQKMNTLRESERFSGWFLAIVQRSSLDVSRRRSRVSAREQGWEEIEGEEGSAPTQPAGADALVRGERGERIRAALRALPPEYREVIILKHSEGRSYREIARLLGTTVKAVESRLFRARQQLSRLLEERERPSVERRCSEGHGKAER
jgi:RNA polymerase sigma-70 factor (ECF subfamily)